MAEIDDIHSNLGALEEQLAELSRLKSLVERLGDAEEAATDAIEAAEHVIEKFDDAANRIEDAEVLQQVEQLRSVLQRLQAVRDELEEHPEALQRLTEQLQEVSTTVETVVEMLEGVQLESRLDTLQDMTSSANQASQNSLSRIDAVERGLSDTLDEHRRRQDRLAEQIQEEVADLQGQFRQFETFTRRVLWAILMVGVLGFGLLGSVAYIVLSGL